MVTTFLGDFIFHIFRKAISLLAMVDISLSIIFIIFASSTLLAQHSVLLQAVTNIAVRINLAIAGMN